MDTLADLTATQALARIRAGRLDAATWRDACLERIAAREGEVRAFAHHDPALVRAVMLMPWTGDPAFNSIWTALHLPCVTVPAGTGPTGMKLGLQVVARRGEDAAALAWAQYVASAMEG